MKVIEYDEMDLDYIALYSVYQTNSSKNKNKSAIVKDVEKLAEMGNPEAQALWYKICGKQENYKIDKMVESYDNSDYRKLYAKACKAYHEEKIQHIILKTKLESEDNIGHRTVLTSEIMDLKSHNYLVMAINKCREKIEMGKASLLDKERRFEMIRKSPFQMGDDVKAYNLGSKPYCLYKDNKSDPMCAFIFASNYATSRPNNKNQIINGIFKRLAGHKLSKNFNEYRGPNSSTPMLQNKSELKTR